MKGWSRLHSHQQNYKRLRGSRALNRLLSLFGRAIAILKSHQRALCYRRPDQGPVMSGVAILGLAAVSVLLGVNIAIAVAVVVLDRR
jgi:hypothetical protein